MITTLILMAIYYAITLLLLPITLLPDVSISTGVNSYLTSLVSYLAVLNTYFSVSDLFVVIGLIISLELIIASYKIIMWVIRRFPTQS